MLVKISLEAVPLALGDKHHGTFHLRFLAEHLFALNCQHIIVEVKVDRQAWRFRPKEQIQRRTSLEGQALPEKRVAPDLVEDAAESEKLFERVGLEAGLRCHACEGIPTKRRHASLPAPSGLAR